MSEALNRVKMVLGEENVLSLANCCVAVIGLGGVGGYACEALARSGVGKFLLVDGDRVEETNINRQLVADYTTLGRYKTEVMAQRIRNVSPMAEIREYPVFIATGEELPLEEADYVIDAIDDVDAKVALIAKCHALNVPLICALGAGNRLYPNRFEVCEIKKTSMDPLARSLRRKLREANVEYPVQCICSTEKPHHSGPTPGSLMPAAGGAGLMLAACALEYLCKGSDSEKK